MAVKKKVEKAADTKIYIPAPNLQTMTTIIEGESPIIFHQWTQKAMQQIEDIQNKKPGANTRPPRDKDKEYRDSFYLTTNGEIAVPALNIKAGITEAVRNLTGVTMALVRGAVFVYGDKEGMIPLLYKNKPMKLSDKTIFYEEGESPTDKVIGFDSAYPDQVEVRRDMVRVMGGGADIRYRGQVREWSAKVFIKYNADVISAEQVLNLLNIAGFSCGLCEWRPQKDGISGTYKVAE